MEKSKIEKLKLIFDNIANKTEDDTEFWYARDLQHNLGYERWENFIKVIDKAKVACQTSQNEIDNHFLDVTKMVSLGSGAEREVLNFMLTRYACYLIAQNADSRKEDVAFAQSYFALQTRRQELIEDRLNLLTRLEARDKLKESEKRLSKNIYERGVDEAGFARIRSKGDSALFGGNTTAEMKQLLGAKDNRALADFLPTVTIAAKNLATEITNYNVEENNLKGEPDITEEHVQNNTSVRSMLGQRGIIPENLPPSEDIQKLQRRVKSEEKKLANNAEKLFNT